MSYLRPSPIPVRGLEVPLKLNFSCKKLKERLLVEAVKSPMTMMMAMEMGPVLRRQTVVKRMKMERGSNEGYENEGNSGEDTESTESGEDDGPAPPSTRKRLSRVYFIED